VLEDFTDVLFDLFEGDCPEAISLDWLLTYVAPKLLDAFPDLAHLPVTPKEEPPGCTPAPSVTP